jgi:hypothetical protein
MKVGDVCELLHCVATALPKVANNLAKMERGEWRLSDVSMTSLVLATPHLPSLPSLISSHYAYPKGLVLLVVFLS